MKIQYLSDIHLEFYKDPYSLVKKIVPNDESDILILAGDITVWDAGWQNNPAFQWFSDNFKHTIYIPGNHEYYNKYPYLSKNPINEKIRDNVYLLNNDFIEIDNVRFICSTLWSKIDPINSFYVVNSLSDYRRIYQEQENYPIGEKLTVPFVNDVCELSKKFIFESISNELNNVVITHHLPSYACIHPRFKGDNINSGFANNDIDDKIFDSNIKYWIFGHSHADVDDIDFDGTILTSNQYGYNGENTNFKPKNIIL